MFEPRPFGCRQSAPRTLHHQGASATRPSTSPGVDERARVHEGPAVALRLGPVAGLGDEGRELPIRDGGRCHPKGRDRPFPQRAFPILGKYRAVRPHQGAAAGDRDRVHPE